MRSNLVSGILLGFLALCGLGGPASAQITCGTAVPAGVVFGQTWTKANAPYCVTGDISVANLAIEPGVAVYVDGPFKIQVLTRITAIGTQADPILFAAKVAGAPWKGLRFEDTPAGSELVWCTIQDSDESGLRLINSSPKLRHLTLQNNSAKAGSSTSGGGLYAELETVDLALFDCTIIDNTAKVNGGGIQVTASNGHTLAVQSTSIVGNIANPTQATGNNYFGGGIYFAGSGGDLLLENSLLDGNIAYSKCNTACCTVESRGGGLFANGGGVKISNTVFTNNMAQPIDDALNGCEHNNGYGGAIYFNSSGKTLSLANCILSCNSSYLGGTTATGKGSGVYVNAGAIEAVNCTFTRNTTDALWNQAGASTVLNSILYWNDVTFTQTQIQGSGTTTVTFSDVQGGYAGTGNIATDPAFNGTTCEVTDVTIIPFSPCVDAGQPAAQFNDCGGWGSLRNDMGAHGGPANCQWGVATGTWTGVAGALAGTLGSPTLTGEGDLLAGSATTLTLKNALQNRPAILIIGLSALNAPCKGGLLVPKNNLVTFGLFTDGMGQISLGGPWPASAPAELSFIAQFWISDPAGPVSFSASNALWATAP